MIGKTTVATALLALAWAPAAGARPDKPANPAPTDAAQVRYGPPAAWVLPAPPPTQTATPTGSPFRLVHFDEQVHVGNGQWFTYQSLRFKLLSAQALALGQLTLSWNPAFQDQTVHSVKVYRDTPDGPQAIDELATNRFAVIQREQNLERAMLTGILTAQLQIPGLRVGDEVEFTTTQRTRDTLFGSHIYGGALMLYAEGVGANRIRLDWSKDWAPAQPLRYQPSDDLNSDSGKHSAGNGQLTPESKPMVWELDDPGKLQVTLGAPARYNIRRLVQFTDFSNWKQLSAAYYPLYDKAATLEAASPLKPEIARIAAASADPLVRAGTALQLVQDQLRYVYVGLGDGNYRPISADESWRNRFGDCKGKTVLLLALLRGLGIETAPVLVNSNGGDDIAKALPSPLPFDHVLVRAMIDGKAYFLDGTLSGDHQLPLLETPVYRYGLPLSAEGSDLERLPLIPAHRPTKLATLDLDASAGGKGPFPVTVTYYLAGAGGAVAHGQLAMLSPEAADRALRQYWQANEAGIEPDSVEWHYDDARSVLVLVLKGKYAHLWDDDASQGYAADIPWAGFFPPNELKRPVELDQKAPWLTDFPTYTCRVTNLRLPKPSKPGTQWNYSAGAFDTTIGGGHYVRRSAMAGGVVRIIHDYQAYLPEISASAAAAIKDAIPGFDNSKGRIYEEPIISKPKPVATGTPIVPLLSEVDWTSALTPCTLVNPIASSRESAVLTKTASSQSIGFSDHLPTDWQN